ARSTNTWPELGPLTGSKRGRCRRRRPLVDVLTAPASRVLVLPGPLGEDLLRLTRDRPRLRRHLAAVDVQNRLHVARRGGQEGLGDLRKTFHRYVLLLTPVPLQDELTGHTRQRSGRQRRGEQPSVQDHEDVAAGDRRLHL